MHVHTDDAVSPDDAMFCVDNLKKSKIVVFPKYGADILLFLPYA